MDFLFGKTFVSNSTFHLFSENKNLKTTNKKEVGPNSALPGMAEGTQCEFKQFLIFETGVQLTFSALYSTVAVVGITGGWRSGGALNNSLYSRKHSHDDIHSQVKKNLQTEMI